MTRTPPRNAPCPCGSGRKYKKCCLETDRGSSRWPTAQERNAAFEGLVAYAEREEFTRDFEIGWRIYWGGVLDSIEENRRAEIEDDQLIWLNYLHWVVFDLALDGDYDTIVARYLSAHGDRLAAPARTFLEAMATSSVRLHEIQSVQPDGEVVFRDLWTDEVGAVVDPFPGLPLAQWDIVAVRVFEDALGERLIGGIPYFFPPDRGPELLAQLRRHRRRLKNADETAFFKRMTAVIHQHWIGAVVLASPPELVTTDGETLVSTKVVFDVSRPDALAIALAGRDDLHPQDDGSFVWLEGGDPPARVLGLMRLAGRRLTVETMSDGRAERARAFLEEIAPNTVEYRMMVEEDVRRHLADSSVSSRPLTPAESEEERAVAEAFYEQHYRKWIDLPVPALGDRTPRRAARLKTVRPTLIQLLKGIENHMDHARLRGDPAVDLSWLWEELGLERPAATLPD